MDQFEVQVEISRLSGTTRMQESLQATVALRELTVILQTVKAVLMDCCKYFN